MFKCMSKLVQEPRYVGKETTTDTSYFCLVIWSCSSNFSASSWYIHSHSSLALFLREVEMQQCSSPCFFPHWVILVILSSVCVTTCNYLRRSWFKLSMSSGLRLSLRIFFFFSLSVCLLPLRFSVYRQVEGIRTHLLDTPIKMHHGAQCAHQLLHVPSKMEAGEGLLFLGIIFGSPLGFLLFLTSSLILDLRR